VTAADRYARARIADNVKAAASTVTAGMVRDNDEALGRAIRQLGERCTSLGGLDYGIVRESVLTATSYRVHVANQRTGATMSDRSSYLPEAVDRILDRLAREAW